MNSNADHHKHGGIIHTYLGYDPHRFPMPDAQHPDLVGPVFEHMIAYGNLEHLTAETLAQATELDPSQIAGLGPSIQSLLVMLEQRKRKILQTYETRSVITTADRVFHNWINQMRPPDSQRRPFMRALGDQQISDLERLWYTLDQRSDFARQLVVAMDHLGHKYEIQQLAAAYDFTGRKELSIDKALQIKEELETIDRLIQQLKETAKDAKLYRVDLDQLARFATDVQIKNLDVIRRQIDQMLLFMAQQQGLEHDGQQFNLTPKAMKIIQSKLLDEVFCHLQASKTGRHAAGVSGDGQVELQRTQPYQFGDSLANMDVSSTLINALIRTGPELPIRIVPQDIQIHLTRHTPKCATVVCMDMSGSMRWSGHYVNVKKMAMALHGLVRSEYPGDFLDFVEVYSLPKRRHISEVPKLLPKPVTIGDPVVRLKVDMSQEGVTEFDVPPHFTNLQHGLKLARQLLQGQDTPNRQIVLITDGLPTAHFEDHWLYLLYPPDRQTERATLREGLLCKQQEIVINIFLLSSWSQSQDDIRFAHRLAQDTTGRVFFTGGDDLDRFVVWDYVRHRRSIIG